MVRYYVGGKRFNGPFFSTFPPSYSSVRHVLPGLYGDEFRWVQLGFGGLN